MKKILTVCMLICAMIMGAMPAEAKTTARKTTTKTARTAKAPTLSVNTFLKLVNSANKWYDYRSYSTISQSLKGLGFTYDGVEDEGYEEGDYDDVYIPVSRHCFSKGKTDIYIYFTEDNWILRVALDFGTWAEHNQFLQAARKLERVSNLSVWEQDDMVFLACYEH